MAAPVRAMSGEGSGSPTARDILSMLRRRQLLIVALFVFLTALSLGGFLVWWFYFPGYRSESLIECISNIPETGLTLEQQRLMQDEHERFVLSQAVLLKSPGILGDALKVNAVRETDWFKSVPRGEYLLELTEDLGASPVRGTNFLRVSMECRSITDGAIIVNEVVNQWYQTVKKRSAEEFADDALEAAQREAESLEREIAQDRERLKTIAERLPAGARQDPGGNIINQQVKQYGEQAASLQLELAQLEEYRRVYNDAAGVAVTADDRNAVELDPEVAELSRAMFLLEQRRAADAKVYGAGHSIIKQLDAQVEATENELYQIRAEKLGERRAAMREATNTAYENTRHALFLTQENLLKAEAALQDQDRSLFDYMNLDAEILRKLTYQTELINYVKSLSRIKNQRTAIKVNVAQSATDPLERNSPNLLLLPAGLFLASFLSVGIALALEMMNTTVRTTQDITRFLDVALLGFVPHLDDEEMTIARVETALRDAPQSMVAEAFRRIRTSLQFCAPVERQRTLLITSPRPEDGKTTVACNLATAMAQGGRRVLLIDANFHRPALQRLFENVKPQGLSNILIGEGTLASLATSTSTPMLDVLVSGPTPPNPAELVGGERWRTLLTEAKSRYDQIIIDSAPVLIASDATVIATEVDGVILVVRAQQNSRGVARRACQLLTGVEARLFGAVLNAAQVTRGGYFREQTRSYYDYQATAPGKQPPAKR